jgi:hypothetical protein
MKNNLRSAVSLFLLSVLPSTGFCANTGSPQRVDLKIYELWASPNADCTGLTRIYNDPAAPYQDMVAGPTFGTLTVANGTYHCIAWKMSDIVTVYPDFLSDIGNCVPGVPSTKDLFRVGDTSLTPDGVTINATTSIVTEDTMYVYLSTQGDDLNVATIPSQPGKLVNPYVVSADNTAFMVTDFTNGIEDLGSVCSPEGVVFSFRYQ